MRPSVLLYVFILFLISCSNVSKVGLKDHTFGLRPAKIVWLQIAGLSEEHLALLRFSFPQANTLTSFEKSTCLGKTWNYNMYKIRPTADESFYSQITGKKNIKGTCDDFKVPAVWNYLERNSYRAGVFETMSEDKQSLMRAKTCEQKDYFKDIYFWKMDPNAAKDSKKFHFSEVGDFKKGQQYFDRSCSKNKCYASLGTNIRSVFKSFEKNNKRFIFIVRDFQYNKAMKSKSYGPIREYLNELNSLHTFFMKYAENNRDFLLLVTSGASGQFGLPEKGEQWVQLEKSKSKGQLSKQTSLLSPVFAYGARSENFCGIFEEVDVFKRLFIGPRFRGLNLNFLK